MCSSSTEYELDPPAERSCEVEPEGSDELFELEAERSTRRSDLNPFSKQWVFYHLCFLFCLYWNEVLIEKWTDFGNAKRHNLSEVLLTKFCLFHMHSFLLVNSVTNHE